MGLEVCQPPQLITVTTELEQIFVETSEAKVTVDNPLQLVEVQTEENVIEVVSGGPAGPPGSDGAPGDDTFNAVAGATIHGDRAVIVVDDEIFHPDTSDRSQASQVIGIAEQSGVVGAVIRVRKRGATDIAGATFAPGFVWCGAGGVLTQNVAGIEWVLPVGRAMNATTIDVSIELPILRSA